MSAIPKYILKRMITDDAVKNTSFGWTISIKNVISPLTVDAAPDNLENLFVVTVDGKQLDNNKFSLAYEGKEATVQDPKAAIGVTVPVGGVIEVRFKGPKLAPGKHTFKIAIITRSDVSIEFERDVK